MVTNMQSLGERAVKRVLRVQGSGDCSASHTHKYEGCLTVPMHHCSCTALHCLSLAPVLPSVH